MTIIIVSRTRQTVKRILLLDRWCRRTRASAEWSKHNKQGNSGYRNVVAKHLRQDRQRIQDMIAGL